MFPTREYVDRFFELFDCQKDEPMTFANLSRELYKVNSKHELSFISKLLHTTDDSLPIFVGAGKTVQTLVENIINAPGVVLSDQARECPYR